MVKVKDEVRKSGERVIRKGSGIKGKNVYPRFK